MSHPRATSPATVEAVRLLAGQVRLARVQRRMTVAELAERVGVSVPTIRKVESGDPTVAIGTAFEAATIVGVVLFDGDPTRRVLEAGRVRDQLALLPQLVRPMRPYNDDF